MILRLEKDCLKKYIKGYNLSCASFLCMSCVRCTFIQIFVITPLLILSDLISSMLLAWKAWIYWTYIDST